MKPSLEIHVPISPTPPFLKMVRCLVTSLRRFGGLYANAPVIVTIGDPVIKDKELLIQNPWITRLGIETRWVPEELYARDIYYATANQRLCYEYSSDMVLLLDADMLIARPLDEVVQRLFSLQIMGGVQGFACPFEKEDRWAELYAACGIGPVIRKHQYTGWPYIFPERAQMGPVYLNLGFVLLPSAIAVKIGEDITRTMHEIAAVDSGYYRCQLALALAIVRQNVPYDLLPLRYNFPNNAMLEALHPLEQVRATVLHLFSARIHEVWHSQGVGKRFLYGDNDGIQQFLARTDLAGINKTAQDVLRSISAELSD